MRTLLALEQKSITLHVTGYCMIKRMSERMEIYQGSEAV